MPAMMGRRGRRQVLQLDAVSSSHQPRHQGNQAPRNNDNRREQASNPLLSLVGDYNSDSMSDDDDDDDKTNGNVQEEKETRTTDEEGPEKEAESQSPHAVEPLRAEKPPAAEQLQEIPLPEPSTAASTTASTVASAPTGGLGSSIDSEVANFLAEIESISTETGPEEKAEKDDDTTKDNDTTADPIPTVEPDIGFIPRPDASVVTAVEENADNKYADIAEEKKSKTYSSSNAYKSMFVKGAPEFVQKNKDEAKGNSVETEELPEEPVSEWQMVQDDATQYYYYWNLVTNEVTWEIPPGYTQFLLLYKEYEERIAKIPADKLQQLREKKEKKKNGGDPGRELSPAPSSSESRSKSSKHKKNRHRKEKAEVGPQLPPMMPEASSSDFPLCKNGGDPGRESSPAPSSSESRSKSSKHKKDRHRKEKAEVGPQLPPMMPETSSSDAKTSSSKSEALDSSKDTVSSERHAGENHEVKTSVASDSAVDSTSASVSAEVEAIFDEALSALAESSVDSCKPAASIITSSSTVETSSSTSPVDVTMSTSVESSKPSSSVDYSKAVSPVPMDTDSVPTTTTNTTSGVSTAVVSSSSVMSTVSAPEKDSKDSGTGNGEEVVTNSGMNDEEDDDFDVDFDDIDDLDRALEKALEKKLEKKKAELEKLEQKQDEDPGAPDSILFPSSPRSVHSQSETPKETTNSQAVETASPSEPESTVSSSVKITAENSSEAPQPSQKSPASATSSSATDSKEVTDSTEAKPQTSKSKRSAAESSTKDDDTDKQEPTVKKARLVAYDAQTDDESMDTADDVSTTPVKSAEQYNDIDNAIDVLPTPPPEVADNLAEIQEMADTAFAKLNFLDVTYDGLSPLQISLIQLQTRLNDWQEGGLNGEYFYQRLREVNSVLKQYESSAVPPGWTCQWDSNFRRYFYINTQTGEAQWDYPEGNTVDSSASGDKKSRKGKGSKKKKVKVIGPEPEPEAVPLIETTSESVEETASAEVAAEAATSKDTATEEDLDGVAMTEEDAPNSELSKRLNDESADSVPASSTTPATVPDSGDGVQSALQALFPGEPLPPGTELLLGLPPPPPPPLPPGETLSATEDAYVCAEDSSDESDSKEGDQGEEKAADMPKLDPEIDGEEMVEEEEEEAGEEKKVEEEVAPVQEDPAVISRPPQLRFPASAVTSLSTSSASSSQMYSGQPTGFEPSSTGPDSASSIIAAPAIIAASSSGPSSPKMEDTTKSAGSPAPANEATSSSTADHHKHEKHKKKKKEKLGSHTMSLKKKGVSSLVQKWQKVKKQVEKEDRDNEQRQLAIRQQLEEWKRENS